MKFIGSTKSSVTSHPGKQDNIFHISAKLHPQFATSLKNPKLYYSVTFIHHLFFNI